MIAMAMAATAASPPAAPRQVGAAEPVPDLQTVAAVRQALRWTPLAHGGRVAALTLSAPGAAAVRVGLRIGELPESARLRFSGPDDRTPIEVSGARVLATLARNADAGETGGAARTWWSPVVAGSSVVMEIELPPGVDAQAVAITAPVLSHLSLDVHAELAALRAAGDAAGAIAVYTIDGASYACAGTLVAPSTAPAAHPYFLTANRCIASQSAASSMELFWDAGAAPMARSVQRCRAALRRATRRHRVPRARHAAARRRRTYAHWASAAKAAPALDPALEQWLGAGVARTSARTTFRLP